MSISVLAISFDAHDAALLALFWAQALHRTVNDSATEEFASIAADTDSRLGAMLMFHTVPEGKAVKNRLHLDLRPADQPAEVARLEALGARQVSIGQGDVSWVVMADPDGNEFDVLRPLTLDELPPGHDALGRRITAGARP